MNMPVSNFSAVRDYAEVLSFDPHASPESWGCDYTVSCNLVGTTLEQTYQNIANDLLARHGIHTTARQLAEMNAGLKSIKMCDVIRVPSAQKLILEPAHFISEPNPDNTLYEESKQQYTRQLIQDMLTRPSAVPMIIFEEYHTLPDPTFTLPDSSPQKPEKKGPPTRDDLMMEELQKNRPSAPVQIMDLPMGQPHIKQAAPAAPTENTNIPSVDLGYPGQCDCSL